MAIHLQSTETPSLYYNGSTINKRGYVLALFGSIDTARNFESQTEALQVSETFEVPVTVVEI